jgi:hypothetical protein
MDEKQSLLRRGKKSNKGGERDECFRRERMDGMMGKEGMRG